MSLRNLRVVLVRPHYAGNVGAVCRLLRNFGLRDLVLVDPIADRNALDARALAVRGVDVLEAAREVATFAEAVADCPVVLATSGETGGLARKGFWGTPEEKLPLLIDAAKAGPAALVFGPEPHGLSSDEVAACHGSIFIPADPDYPSLNLSQAVAICLYQLHRLAQESGAVPGVLPPAREEDAPAGFDAQERAYSHLYEGLAAVRFLWDFRADGIFHVLRQMLVRSRPTVKEVQILHGLARQLTRVARRYGIPHPRDDNRPNAPPFERNRRPAETPDAGSEVSPREPAPPREPCDDTCSSPPSP